MAKRLTDEGKIVAIYQYQPLEKAETMLALAQAIVKQRVAAERGGPVKKKAVKKAKGGKQVSFDTEAMVADIRT